MATPAAPAQPAYASTGFGAKHLAKLGWESGSGLGKDKQGMTTHVRVSRRAGSRGLAAKASTADHGFQWWDHVYNKSTADIVITPMSELTGGIAIGTVSGNSSSAGPSDSAEPVAVVADIIDDPLAAMFVRPASTSTDGDAPTKRPPSTGPFRAAAALDADEQSFCMPMTDADLLRVCEGRTARVGARTGLAPAGDGTAMLGAGKLARVDAHKASVVPLAAVPVHQVDTGRKEKKEGKEAKKRKRSRDVNEDEEERREAKRQRRLQKKEEATSIEGTESKCERKARKQLAKRAKKETL
ncbi:hypothetical protein BC828DRAFT_413559 [Blastocladiella britannica]|nr:hypothetical protein BC828DRAFT_413559 [Blastocladiella britannica]